MDLQIASARPSSVGVYGARTPPPARERENGRQKYRVQSAGGAYALVRMVPGTQCHISVLFQVVLLFYCLL